MKNIQPQKAFTLYEMLIVLTISMLVAGLSLPSWKQLFNSTNDKILAATIVKGIQFARLQAISRGTLVGFIKYPAWINGQGIIVDSNNDGTVTDQKQIIAIQTTPRVHGELFWDGFPFYRDYLQFQPSGLITNANGTFCHCHANKMIWAIVISKSGLTRIVMPDSKGKIKDSHNQILDCV